MSRADEIPTSLPTDKRRERLAEIKAASERGSADWLDPIVDARFLLAEVTRLECINRRLVSDFNGMLVLNSRLSRELEALGRAPGWDISAVDLLDVMRLEDLLAAIKRRVPDA